MKTITGIKDIKILILSQMDHNDQSIIYISDNGIEV